MNDMLSLTQIAAWQIDSPAAHAGAIVAALPAMQRGAVWKVRQIEDLWDSLLRQFPVGSFIVSPIDGKRGQQRFRLQQDDVAEATHHLLDGQQRATGIALGFYDVWQAPGPAQARATCWIDLDAAPDSRDVEFVARVQTLAHPWGYGRTDPDARLPQHRIRAAIKAYQAVNPEHAESRPEAIPLALTWPWDCAAPVPLAILIAALDACAGDVDAARRAAWERVRQLPMCRPVSALDAALSAGTDDPALQAARDQLALCRANLTEAFTDDASAYAARLRDLLERLGAVARRESAYRIPVLHLALDNWMSYESKRQAVGAREAPRKDPVELLFVRINSAGTPLAGEELVYSLLKSAWVEVPGFIDSLAHKPAGPARIAGLCIRLVQARQQLAPDGAAKRAAMPVGPGVDEFRRLMHGDAGAAFRHDLRRYIEEEAAATFEDAWHFLTDAARAFALPRVVAAELAQKAPDVFFLLLYWIDRLAMAGTGPADLKPNQHRRALGFLTAVAWFAPDRARTVATLWPFLQAESDPARLRDFFNARHFGHICRLDDQLQSRMIPLVSAEALDLACKKRVTGHVGCKYTISKPDSEIWSAWDWSGWLVDPTAEELGNFYREALYPEKIGHAHHEVDVPESARTACGHFFDVLRTCHPMLLFAQRKWIGAWFPSFDPALPEFMEDKNRPWDYDHIHPQTYLRGDGGFSMKGMPQLIKDWHGSIGNLRAWPLEINRSDGDNTPRVKLGNPGPVERRYRLDKAHHKRDASFVREDQLALWEGSVPQDADRSYLRLGTSYVQRHALVKAMVYRCVDIYSDWYRELRLADLH